MREGFAIKWGSDRVRTEAHRCLASFAIPYDVEYARIKQGIYMIEVYSGVSTNKQKKLRAGALPTPCERQGGSGCGSLAGLFSKILKVARSLAQYPEWSDCRPMIRPMRGAVIDSHPMRLAAGKFSEKFDCQAGGAVNRCNGY
jgi:hypothetical protein